MKKEKPVNSDDPIVHISAPTYNIIASQSEKWVITRKEYVDFCVKFCSSLELNPHTTNHRIALKKINTKRTEENIIARFNETRNTIISFIKQMEKEQFSSVNTRLSSIENQLKNESRALALNQLKSSIIIADMLSEILTDDKNLQKKFFDKYVKRLNAQ